MLKGFTHFGTFTLFFFRLLAGFNWFCYLLNVHFFLGSTNREIINVWIGVALSSQLKNERTTKE